MSYAQLCELGQVHAKHEMIRVGREMRIQGKPALHWVYEVARDCTYIDEVRLVSNGTVVSFKIDRECDPPFISVDQYSVTQEKAS